MPDIGQPSASDKNDPDEIRDGVVSDATRFPGGFIDQAVTDAGADVAVAGKFEVTNAAFVRSFDLRPQLTNPRGVAFSADGAEVYGTGLATDDVAQYSLSTSFDISTGSFTRSIDVSSRNTNATGVTFKPDGSELYVIGSTSNEVNQYSLSTDFDISTASFTQSFDVSTEDGNSQSLTFRPDGSQLYVVGKDGAEINEYALSTGFDISTASFTQSFDVSAQDGGPQGVAFNSDGSRLFMAGSSTNKIYQYSLSTGFDVSTASFTQSLSMSSSAGSPLAVTFNTNGSQMYVVGKPGDDINQFAIGTLVGGP